MFNPIKCGCSVLFFLLVILLTCGAISYFFVGSGAQSLREKVIDKFLSADPKDLGVRYSEADVKSARDQMGVELITKSDPTITPENSLILEGSKPVDTSFTSAQITALIGADPYKYYPVDNVQVKVNPDGMVEMSGVIVAANVIPYLKAVDLYSVDVDDALQKYLTKNVSFYFNATGTVEKNNVSLDIASVKVGPIGLPSDVINSNKAFIETTVESLLGNLNGINLDSVNFDGGKMNVKGLIPTTKTIAVD